jgi:hypothetical protein
MRIPISASLYTAILMVKLAAFPAWADPLFLPLEIGNTWSYEAPPDEAEIMTVIGVTEVLGAEVKVIDFSASTYNDPLQNYWTLGTDGDVLLWGFFRDEDGGWGAAYFPPISMVDVPASVGATWACTTQIYSLPGEIPQDVAVFELTVTWEGVLSLPAGSFQAIGVGFADPSQAEAGSSGYFLDGRLRRGRSEAERWYSDGVGLVQYDTTSLYQLLSFGTTPVEPSSWARIKVLYR